MNVLARVAALAALASALTAPGHAQKSPAPWSAASGKSGRCAAIVRWYEATLQTAGPDAFSPNMEMSRLQKVTARGFVDDVFVPSIGVSYNTLTPKQRKSLASDIGSCGMGPVDPVMSSFIQTAFSNDQNQSLVRGWPGAITTAQRIEGDKAALRGGARSSSDIAKAQTPKGFLPYFQATSVEQRCAALQAWYERGKALSGPNLFARTVTSSTVTVEFSRAFVDDIFPVYFGVRYKSLQQQQGAQIREDIVTCNTPAVGQWAKVVGSAFVWGRYGRDAWLPWIDTEEAKYANMAYAAIPERALLAEAKPPPGKAPGPHDKANRTYSRMIYSDSLVSVGVRDNIARKCQMSLGYAVGIDIAPDESFTATTAKDVMDRILVPLAGRECPGTDLTIDAEFYLRTRMASRGGVVAPAGAQPVMSETSLALVSYGPGHRRENVAPTMYYGGINRNYPELARFDGIVDYERRGLRRDPEAVARYAPAPPVMTYVNYTPSQTPAHLASLPNGKLIGQIAARDFFGIHRDPDEPEPAGEFGAALSTLVGWISGLPQVDRRGVSRAPRQRGFVFAVQAYGEVCRASLGRNPAIYQEVYQKIVREETHYGPLHTVTTRYWDWDITDPVYMDQGYLSRYSDMFKTEKSMLIQDLGALSEALFTESDLAGPAGMRPFLIIKGMKDTAAAHFRAVGCEEGKKLLRNWKDFLDGAPTRTDGAFPTAVVESSNGQVFVDIGDVPAQLAPAYPYKDGTWLHVDYTGDRSGGLLRYSASHFNFLYLPDDVDGLKSPQNAELLASFRTDRIRILNCFYAGGTVNYWLEGFPQPSERQRAAAGASFKGTARQCPPAMAH